MTTENCNAVRRSRLRLRPRSLKRDERVLLLEALRLIIRVRLSLTLRQFDSIRSEIIACRASRPASLHNLRRTVWAVQAMARFIPKATCLTQALSGQLLLARRGEASTIRLTVPTKGGPTLRPHAWLFSGDTILLGGSASSYREHSLLVEYDTVELAPKAAGSKAAP